MTAGPADPFAMAHEPKPSESLPPQPAAERRPATSRDRAARAALVSERLAQLRREQQLSQDAVGQLVDASQATVSRWEDPASLSTPSVLEAGELAAHFEVDAAWLLGLHDQRDALPRGHAIIDQALLDAFAAAESADEIRALLDRDMTFGTIWTEIPAGAEVVPMQEALRRVKEVDRRLRDAHPDLWQDWARLVLS